MLLLFVRACLCKHYFFAESTSCTSLQKAHGLCQGSNVLILLIVNDHLQLCQGSNVLILLIVLLIVNDHLRLTESVSFGVKGVMFFATTSNFVKGVMFLVNDHLKKILIAIFRLGNI